MIRFAFYGRVSTEDQQDPESSRSWQLTRSRSLIEPRDGQIVAEYFDIDKSRSIPWQRRPRATALLAELKNPNRGFDAVVIGEPHRAFYGNQYGLTFPIFEHYGVPLWVPEVGGPIDPANEAHDLVTSVFGGMSKGERNRIKIRVRTAMAAQAKDEGRFLGGRPPYGYLIADAGPHPNPAKAADGKRLHKLALDPRGGAPEQWRAGHRQDHPGCRRGVRGYPAARALAVGRLPAQVGGLGSAVVAGPDPAAAAPVIPGAHHPAAPAAAQQALQQPAAFPDRATALPGRGGQFACSFC